MRLVRPAALLLATLVVGLTAGAARSGISAPTGLHGFLLRSDEAFTTTFFRTPSFAWNPVAGADHYEFQLSLSGTFHDNSVIYSDLHAASPVEATPLTLPWITGNPFSLYARVRAITTTGATPWSSAFGFNVVPPAAPTPLTPSYPGLLRWTPVEGASGYQVWLIEPNKIETVATNVLDEREYYTFHTASSWTGTVHWRVRALRSDNPASGRLNGIPVVQHGAWSPIYTATNPAPTDSPIQLVGTVSDVVSDGTNTSPAHTIMPAFTWKGDEGLFGNTTELFRVYVFTDSQCLNRVFTSAVIGSPAYAPRAFGPLALPGDDKSLAAARTTYLADGSEPSGYTYDAEKVTATESDAAATPTTSVPGALGDTTGSTSTSTTSSSSSGSSSTVGAPTDLWDVNWPASGYYWTVVSVSAVHVGNTSSLAYQDEELPQDTCASGRVMRFGMTSTPSLTASGNVFATGLSSGGRLTSALHTTAFYGAPLVAWMPANGADIYEVQWSKTDYPFVPETAASGGTGEMTSSTSLVLPVGPGVWWYRVRGFDYSLPTGSQQMTWSDPARLVVAKPTFQIIGGSTPARSTVPAGMKLTTGEGFKIAVPTSWQKVSLKDSLVTFAYRDPVEKNSFRANVNVLRGSGRAGRTFAQWSADLATELRTEIGVTPSTSVVTLPAGKAVRLIGTASSIQSVRLLQYYVDAGANAYVVTFECSAASYPSYAARFAKSIASLQLG